MSSRSYHLEELEIAKNPDDPRRLMPPIFAHEQKILDIGCGAGQTLIASSLPAQTVAVGIDPDISALILGRQLSASVQFVCGKGEALPFASNYFDLVISRVAIPHMRIETALAEMCRVLKTGGRVWAALHPPSMTLREFAGSLSRLEVKGALYRLYVLANGTALHLSGREVGAPFGKQRYESFQTRKAIRRSLVRAGFEDVEFDTRKGFVVSAKKNLIRGEE